MSGEPRSVSTERVYDGRLLKVDRERFVNPAGKTLEIEMIRHPGAAAVVPVFGSKGDADPDVLILRQFRYAAGGAIWEIPAGVLEPEESPHRCAERELLEEGGAVAGDLTHLASIFTTPGFTDERIHLFLATELQSAEPDHQPDEFIEIETRRLSQLMAMIKDGELVDAKSIVAISLSARFFVENP